MPNIGRKSLRAIQKGLEAVGERATGLPGGGTANNMKAAIAGETEEYTDMYSMLGK